MMKKLLIAIIIATTCRMPVAEAQTAGLYIAPYSVVAEPTLISGSAMLASPRSYLISTMERITKIPEPPPLLMQGAGANASIEISCPSGYTHVQGAVVLSGTTTSAVIAAVASQFIYVKSLQVVNFGSTNAYVSLYTNGTATPIAYTVAPTATAAPMGGSNVPYTGTLQTTVANKSFDAGASASSTSITVSAQGCQGP